MKTIYIDIDNTIVDDYDLPRTHLTFDLLRLKEKSYELVIWTGYGTEEDIRGLLTRIGIADLVDRIVLKDPREIPPLHGTIVIDNDGQVCSMARAYGAEAYHISGTWEESTKVWDATIEELCKEVWG